MSDNRTKAENGDVLSSVLRLVSEDLRVPGRVLPEPSAETKLLLTADQRIGAAASGAPAPVPEAAAEAAAPLTAAPLTPVPHGPTPVQDAQPASGRGMAAGAALPDEAALRDMIREILRDELRGPLGERITRTVRKLVLAEVQRALATRDLD